MTFRYLENALKEFVQSLQLSTVFPAALVVLVNLHFVMPCFWEFDLLAAPNLVLATALTLVLSYTLYAFNYPLIRLFEGYHFKYGSLLPRLFPELLEKQKAEFWRRIKGIAELNEQLTSDSPGDEWSLQVELSRLESEFEFDYPSTEDMVLPTRLGNAVAAFEEYSGNRYGMDSIALWPRLVPVLKEEGYLEIVAQEKSVFDFLLNTCVVSIWLGVELCCVNLYLGKASVALWVVGGMPLVISLLYYGMIMAAQQWGLTVRVAFDLYRHRLHQRLGLREAQLFSEEYDQWEQISEFMLFRRGDYRKFEALMTCAETVQRENSKVS